MRRADKIGLNLPWSVNIAGIHIKLLHLVWIEPFNLLQIKNAPHLTAFFCRRIQTAH